MPISRLSVVKLQASMIEAENVIIRWGCSSSMDVFYMTLCMEALRRTT